jgi:mannose-1-phosphate guanylyltransferase
MHPEIVILLGIEPDNPKTSYGWIEPGEPFEAAISELSFSVARFWEKPSLSQAVELHQGRCLWNSFIMVGCVTAFLEMIHRAVPGMHSSFGSIQHLLGSPFEQKYISEVYDTLSSSSFTDDVLTKNSRALIVLRSEGFEWRVLGEPARVISLYQTKGIKSEEELLRTQKLTT